MADQQKPDTRTLTAEEQEILDWYRRLSESDQHSLLQQARRGDTPAHKARRAFYAGGGRY